jgi:hypothetical protein
MQLLHTEEQAAKWTQVNSFKNAEFIADFYNKSHGFILLV